MGGFCKTISGYFQACITINAGNLDILRLLVDADNHNTVRTCACLKRADTEKCNIAVALQCFLRCGIHIIVDNDVRFVYITCRGCLDKRKLGIDKYNRDQDKNKNQFNAEDNSPALCLG